MKKMMLSVVIAVLMSSTNALADMRPYLGASLNFFSINTDLTGTGSGFFSSSTGEISDSGTAVGISAGSWINDNSKIDFAYYSGKESDSSVMTVTVTRVTYDYSFNNRAVHHGWFLGGGVSNVSIEFESSSITTASSASATGLVLRAGYESRINDNLVLELVYNLNFADVTQSNDSVPPGLVFDYSQDVDNFAISIYYLF